MTTILVILAEGFEEIEAVTIIDILRRGGLTVTTAGLSGPLVTGAHGITLEVEEVVTDLEGGNFSAVVLPGGMVGTKNLLKSPQVKALLQSHAGTGKIVAAICAAPWVLEEAGLLAGKEATIYPGLEDKICSATSSPHPSVVTDGNIITSKGPATAMEFALTLLQKLSDTPTAQQVSRDILRPQ